MIRCFELCRHFSPVNVDMQLGIQICNGLDPKRNHYMWFKDNIQDGISGNSFIANKFSDGERQAKQFNTSFCVCPPSIDQAADKDKDRTHKTRTLSDLIQKVTLANWKIGSSLSVDEMCAGFQGKDSDASKISFKKEGDGYLADTAGQGGKHDWAVHKAEAHVGGAIALASGLYLNF